MQPGVDSVIQCSGGLQNGRAVIGAGLGGQHDFNIVRIQDEQTVKQDFGPFQGGDATSFTRCF